MLVALCFGLLSFGLRLFVTCTSDIFERHVVSFRARYMRCFHEQLFFVLINSLVMYVNVLRNGLVAFISVALLITTSRSISLLWLLLLLFVNITVNKRVLFFRP